MTGSVQGLLTLITLRSKSKLFRKMVLVYLNHINILTLTRISLYLGENDCFLPAHFD